MAKTFIPDANCPKCDSSLLLSLVWANSDYDDEFEYVCRRCKATLIIEVYHEPNFGASLKEEG